MSDSLKGLAVGAAIVLGAFIALPGGWFLAESAWTVHASRPHLVQTLTDTNRAVIAIGAAAGNVEKASRAWEQSSKDQASETTKAMSHVNAFAVQSSDFVSRTDKSLNLVLIPALQASILRQDASLSETQRQAQQTFSKLGTTADAFTSATKSVDRRISDPNIDRTIANAADMTGNGASAVKHLDGMAKDGQEVADHFKAEILKPLAVWRKIVDFILDKGYKARAYYP